MELHHRPLVDPSMKLSLQHWLEKARSKIRIPKDYWLNP